MSSAVAILKQNVAVYLGNATAVRDYRVQLRGNRAVLLWALYLIVLIGFGMLTYMSAAGVQSMSVVEAQSRLQGFYQQVMILLATLIGLIAPALTATSIVAERQRKSLDLVFSAPVSPKYYLVGKMISSYRYIWMLLVLSLPVTAACVVLGGAIWSEVLACYALLSLHGLVYTAIGLLFSTLAQRPVGAIVWSYIGVAGYMILMTSLAGPLIATSMFGSGQMNGEMPFIVVLSPYTVPYVAASYTTMFGYQVPNWLLGIGFTVVLSKLILLGAGSSLSTYGSAETKGLRLYGLIYMFLSALGIAAAFGSTMFIAAPIVASASASPSYNRPDYEIYFARQFLSLLIPLMFVIPFITCYGTDLEKKFWPDGIFRPSRMWIATPSGGLPYLIALTVSAAAGVLAYGYWHPEILGWRIFAHIFFGLMVVFAAWSVGRLTSALNNGLRYARTMQFTVLTLVLAVPLPFLTIADSFGFTRDGPSPWDLYILRPLFSTGDKTTLALAFGTCLLLLGLVLARVSESTAKTRYARTGMSYERQ